MTSQSTTRSDNSPEVKTLTLLQLIDGISAIVIGLLVLISLGGSQIGLSMLIIIFGAGGLVTGWGLWNIKDWAYKVAELITLMYFFLAILVLPIGFILLIINAILFFYLGNPEIKEIYDVSGPDIKKLALLLLIDGITAIVIGLLVLISLGGSQIGLSMLIIIFGAGGLVAGWGLWNIKDWAYKVVKLITLIYIIAYFLLAILALPIGFILLIINAVLLFYLGKPKIKEIYKVSGFLS